MEKKLANFSGEKYPYVSEYPYDNTSEEAIYTLAKMFGNKEIMSMVDEKRQEPAEAYSPSGITMEIQRQSVGKTGLIFSIQLPLPVTVWMTGFACRIMD